MKSMKRVLSFILVLILLLTVFTGCKKEEDVNKDPAKEKEAQKEKEVEEEEEEEIDLSEHVTIKWYLHGSNVTDDKDVLEKANEYLNEKLNMTLEPIWGTWGDFDENVVLSIQGGDDVDIYFTCSWSANEYNAYARKGAYVRLDDPENNLIEKYAQELWDILPDVLIEGATIPGADGLGVYAVPGYKDIATQYCWDVNVDLLEKYGYTVEDIENTDYYGFGDIFEKVKKGEGENFYPLLIEGHVLQLMVTGAGRVTGDTTNLLAYFTDPEDPTKPGRYGDEIVGICASDEYKKFIEKTREYFLAGYIDPVMGNPNQANDARVAKQLSADYLIGTQSYAYGYEAQASRERGIEVQYVPASPLVVDSTSAQGAMMAISTASKNPERAMMFLNLLNTDPYLMTLLNYGIEGVHYEMVDGEAHFTEKRDDYIPWTMGMGNVTLLPPQEGQGADFQEKFKEFYDSAVKSPLLGFVFDSTPVEAEMGALTNVAAEYSLSLDAGTVDPAKAHPEYLEKLEANGIDKVIEEANKQLQKFFEEKGEQ